jgi:hypothetical protein
LGNVRDPARGQKPIPRSDGLHSVAEPKRELPLEHEEQLVEGRMDMQRRAVEISRPGRASQSLAGA